MLLVVVIRATHGRKKESVLKKTSVLFVCMGNICRSPTAEAVFRHVLQQNSLVDCVEVDSAGVDAYHVGEPPDSRAQQTAERRGYDLSRILARRVVSQDFDRFDLVLAMDKRVMGLLRSLCPPDHSSRLALYMDYAQHFDVDEVPDPYYGGVDGFERVLDMIEDASQGLLATIGKHN